MYTNYDNEYYYNNPYYHNFIRSSHPTAAIAYVKGGSKYPNINGTVIFRDVADGCEVYVNIKNLPPYRPAEGSNPQIGPFGFHIHEKPCGNIGTNDNPFPQTGEHWNPTNQPHGNHAGDFPVLFSNSNNITKMSFFTSKFKVRDIINRSIVIHESPDDYRTQPSGNSGKKIACGTIRAQAY
ncbi:Cu/Zn superoxide dismutase [Clostridium pasteurianum DSM 525 = ATCC 6013]|uniref:Cu/Zn superoxide dismutase n=1 Tax=Clostridium pasteurianum DSM 525 = ATCC 6013 TaxID=1262449 RepID=A0A0H3J1C0_CLOPA|nr:superoxide dismutase family protein [Clostridium pasteurianum]AJA47656.1 Cu/Zn superoxide dismutase [Clostridium pasteurianum DSM 525 = ATCC 6013]AJA51644.1 Cu/Zn superoxide dismutase [Clostridium pasteurianum DSM 525 = ATCC 6013]AOZ74963.1 superoxide dismutase [Clostridium pasteurianum DSM 525 = ATCC 6013]AOZ78758.1 superoxide dismutase [Clostridium pasteurianum]ELP58005.1 Superoxide dismutase, Cu-Zn family protein [Clostridium pasteurianum DSM 525 = ATCC 6013]